MDNVNRFGERLLALREEREETQSELAEAIGITRQSLSRYETNERTPNIDLIYNVAKHYNVSADYLLGLSEVKSLDNDIQTACKITGLSEKAIESIKLAQSTDLSLKLLTDAKYSQNDVFYKSIDIINMELSSSFFSEQITLMGIYFNEIINKYYKRTIANNLYDEITKVENKTDEKMHQLYEIRNKLQNEWEDLEEMTYYNEFRLTKLFNEFLSYLNCKAKEITENLIKEASDNAEHNPKEE